MSDARCRDGVHAGCEAGDRVRAVVVGGRAAGGSGAAVGGGDSRVFEWRAGGAAHDTSNTTGGGLCVCGDGERCGGQQKVRQTAAAKAEHGTSSLGAR